MVDNTLGSCSQANTAPDPVSTAQIAQLRFDVVAIGEALIDFTEHGRSKSGMRLFEQNAGGAPANVVAALARLGLRTAFIGKVGDDGPGRFLQTTLADIGINTDGMVLGNDSFTTLAFVEISAEGEREFSFARKPGADTCLTEAELRHDIAAAGKVLHFGSLSLTNEPTRGTTLKAVDIARSAGRIISFDPNYRPLLWPSEGTAVKQMLAGIKLANVVKVSVEESLLLTGIADPAAAAQQLLNLGPAVVVVTLGKCGAMAATSEGTVQVPEFPGKVVDTTGAGDSFWGGFLAAMLERSLTPETIDLMQAYELARVGNAVASCCIGHRGGIPAMPDRAAVKKLLARYGEADLLQ
jgi:fructokinase